MRSCLIREHPCLRLPRHLPLHPSSLLLSFSTNGAPSPSLRGYGSLYTRSVAVLNVLSLLMPRLVCPRGRTFLCPPPSFSCGPILSYTLRVFIVQNSSVKDYVGERKWSTKRSKAEIIPELHTIYKRRNIKGNNKKSLYKNWYLDNFLFSEWVEHIMFN